MPASVNIVLADLLLAEYLSITACFTFSEYFDIIISPVVKYKTILYQEDLVKRLPT